MITRICSYSVKILVVICIICCIVVFVIDSTSAQQNIELLGFKFDKIPDSYDYIIADVKEEQIYSKYIPLTVDEVRYEGATLDFDAEPIVSPTESPISMDLEALLTRALPSEPIEIIVSVVSPSSMEPLPPLRYDYTENSPEYESTLDARAEYLATIREERLDSQKELVHLISALGGEVLEQFTLCNCLDVQLPADQVFLLAKHPDVTRIEPNRSLAAFSTPWSTPIRSGSGSSRPVDARSLINSDPLFNLGWGRGNVAVIDSGVGYFDTSELTYSYHDIFRCNAASPLPPLIRHTRDCVSRTQQGNRSICPNQNNKDAFGDDMVESGHGTRSIAIINGLDSLGSAYRGVTRTVVDSYKVSGSSVTFMGNKASILTALDQAVGESNLIFINQENIGTVRDALARAVDDAFDAGLVVLSSVGNLSSFSLGGDIGVPASAAKIISVGAYNPRTLKTIPVQKYGPLPDGRNKPEVQFPTLTETASTAFPGTYR